MNRLSKEQGELIAQSEFFDAEWYVQQYPEVLQTGLTAIEHYCLFGSAFGKDPGPDFSSFAYRRAYPDVAANDIDPLWHFLTKGRAEGRDVPVDFCQFWLERLLDWQPGSPVELNQITLNESNNWYTTGDDPFVVYDVKEVSAQTNWLLIKINNRCQVSLTSKVYLDEGDGFSELGAFSFALKERGATYRLVKLTKPLQRFRFDPTDKPNVSLSCRLSYCLLNSELALQWLISLLSADLVIGNEDVIDLLSVPSGQGIPLQSLSLVDRAYQYYLQQEGEGRLRSYYKRWLDAVEPKLRASQTEVKRKLAQLQQRPVISFLLPLRNPSREFLALLVERLLAQPYSNWQLCVVDDASTDPSLELELRGLAEQDPRIVLSISQSHQGEVVSRNQALAMATGDWLALIEQDDLLAEDVLFEVLTAINEMPNVALLYADDDSIDPLGNRFNPHFKTAWNPDLFYSQNYLSRFVLFRRDVLTAQTGFRAQFAAACVYDFYLQLIEHLQPEQIGHIPRVLYHVRESLLPKTKRTDKLRYTEAALLVLAQHFERIGLPEVTAQPGLISGSFKVCWPLPADLPKVSILIPTRDCFELISVAVSSILTKTRYANYEIVILDNGSEQPETLNFFAEIQQQDSRVRVLNYNYPFNYSAINNFGVAHTDGELVALVNNDIEVINAEWLCEMVSLAIRPDIGCVGAKLYYEDKTIQHAGVVLGIGGVASHGHKRAHKNSNGYFGRLKLIQNYSAVTAACLVVKRSLYHVVGGLNEVDLTIAYNDVDFCLKIAQQGVRNIWTPYAQLLHYESVSRGEDNTPEKIERLHNEREYMLAHWASIIDSDPYYSTYLTRNADDFSLGDGFSKPLKYEGNIFYQWQKPLPVSARKKFACVFVGFDGQSKLHDYVVYYLASLVDYFDIHFVTTAEELHQDPSALAKLQQYCCSVTVRKNEGYDFGSWKYGISNNYNELCQYQGVLLANDSLYGPLFELTDFIDFVQASPSDVIGLTDSQEFAYHLQSFFLFFKPNVVSSPVFRDFWESVIIQGDKWDIIKKYEIGLSQRLLRAGNFKLEAYCDMSGYPNVNHTHSHWRELISDKGFPFLKIELVKKNPCAIDISGMEAFIENISGYNYALITKHN